MGTNAIVHAFPKLAVHAQDLEALWVVVSSQPPIELSSLPMNFAHLRAVVMNVVYGQEGLFSLATTATLPTSVSDKALFFCRSSQTGLFFCFPSPVSFLVFENLCLTPSPVLLAKFLAILGPPLSLVAVAVLAVAFSVSGLVDVLTGFASPVNSTDRLRGHLCSRLPGVAY
jgi:hypothetical protein